MLWILLVAVGIILACYHFLSWLMTQQQVGSYNTKYVLITGCDRGFGNLLTKRLDKLGFNVFASCYTKEGEQKLKEECSSHVTTLSLDVTNDNSIADAVRTVQNKLPPNTGLWGLVNNAGIGGAVSPSEWLSKEDWIQALSLNLVSVAMVTKAFLPLIRISKGRVVNIASMLGRFASGPAPYCAAKFGVEAFSDCLRREVYDQGIKVCILEPGYFKTDIIDSSTLNKSFQERFDKMPSDILKHYPVYTPITVPRLVQRVREESSDQLEEVIDAYEIALTSKYPPTRQMVGSDCKYFARLLWNLPTPLADWILVNRFKMMSKAN